MKTTLAILTTLAIATSARAQVGIIVKVQLDVSPHFLAKAYDVVYADRTVEGPFLYFQAADETAAHVAIAAMATNPAIEWAEDDKYMEVVENTNGKGGSIPQLRVNPIDTLFSITQGYQLNANWLNQIHWTADPNPGREVRVAILDTGLSPHQPTLWARTVASMTAIPRETNAYDVRSMQVGSRFFDPNGALGHGTMVTGIVAQLAPNAKFIVCRVSDTAGRSNAWRLIKGISFAVSNRAELLNMSLGSRQNIPALSDVLEWAQGYGATSIAAIGNDNTESALSPARLSKSIAVTAVDELDRKASFSNWNGTADMAAPGTGIRSAYWNGQMAVWSGTSFAAPIVTGCIAEALKATNPIHPEVLRDLMDGAGDNIDALNPAYQGDLGPRVNMQKVREKLR